MVSTLDSLVENIMQKRKAIKFISQRLYSKEYLTECKLKNPFNKKPLKSYEGHADVDLYLLKTCAEFLGKVTRSKRIKDKKIQPMYKYTFTDVLPFMFKVSRHVVINFKNNG